MSFWKNLFRAKVNPPLWWAGMCHSFACDQAHIASTQAEKHPPSPPQGGNDKNATAWGRYVAACVHHKHGNALQKILATWQWRLIIVAEEHAPFPLPRFAVWEGDTKTIRLCRAPLQRKFAHLPRALALACAHEMFHGLVANSYQKVLPSHLTIPQLTAHAEEVAAHAFAHEFVTNFRLTLEA